MFASIVASVFHTLPEAVESITPRRLSVRFGCEEVGIGWPGFAFRRVQSHDSRAQGIFSTLLFRIAGKPRRLAKELRAKDARLGAPAPGLGIGTKRYRNRCAQFCAHPRTSSSVQQEWEAWLKPLTELGRISTRQPHAFEKHLHRKSAVLISAPHGKSRPLPRQRSSTPQASRSSDCLAHLCMA